MKQNNLKYRRCGRGRGESGETNSFSIGGTKSFNLSKIRTFSLFELRFMNRENFNFPLWKVAIKSNIFR